jgi:hypothetical protein
MRAWGIRCSERALAIYVCGPGRFQVRGLDCRSRTGRWCDAKSRASERIPAPLPGANVSESIVTLSKTRERVSKATMWEETFGSGFLELQETTAAAGQNTVEYWVLTADHRRCVLNGDAVYGKDGRLLSSNFWRNDSQLRFPGSPQFPIDVFPSRIPPAAILLTLDALEPGATGKLNVVLGPYGYMTFDLPGTADRTNHGSRGNLSNLQNNHAG